MGWLTIEELWWNDKGKLMTHAPSTYKIPVANDVPAEFNVRIYESGHQRRGHDPSLEGDRRAAADARHLGASAIRDAIAAIADYRCRPPLDAPATAEAILTSVEELKQRHARTQAAAKATETVCV